jgi:RNA polymerase sigma-B factor
VAVALRTSLPSRAPHSEEDLLWARRTAGDASARALLVERYLRLAHTLARRYARTSEPLEDLEQVASLGLVRAVDRFDPARGSSFSTFAVPTILGELRRHFRDHTWAIRVPRELRDAWIAVDRTREALSAQMGRSPSPAEVSRATGLSVERVVEAAEVARAYRCDSLDRRVFDGDDEAVTLGDRVGAPDAELARAEAGLLLDQLASRALSARDREVLRLRVEDDMLQREIAERVGLSQMQVSRILRDAVVRLVRAGETEPSRPAVE